MLFVSCDVSKSVQKSAASKTLDENIERITRRAGDTVVYKTQLHLKDTTIYTINRQGTTLKTVYDTQGNVSSIDCYASALETMERIQRNLQEQQSDKQKQETAAFDATFILYIVGGLVVVVCFGFLLVFKTINSNSKAIAALLQRMP